MCAVQILWTHLTIMRVFFALLSLALSSCPDDQQAEICVSQAENDYVDCVSSCEPLDQPCISDCNREYRIVTIIRSAREQHNNRVFLTRLKSTTV